MKELDTFLNTKHLNTGGSHPLLESLAQFLTAIFYTFLYKREKIYSLVSMFWYGEGLLKIKYSNKHEEDKEFC